MTRPIASPKPLRLHLGRVAAGLALALLLAGCGALPAPAVPPQLTHTPGPPVVVTADEVRTTAFQARYPRGWKIITAAAFSDPWVIFLHPDETALIVLAQHADDAAVDPPQASGERCRVQRAVTLNDSQAGTVTAALVAEAGGCDAHLATFERTLASLRPGVVIR